MTVEILLIFIGAKIVILTVTGVILWKVMGSELRSPRQTYGMPGVRCVYCHDTPSILHGEEERWEENELVMVRTFECRRCHMPFWQIERVKTVSKRGA